MDVRRRILLCHCVGGDLAQVEGAARVSFPYGFLDGARGHGLDSRGAEEIFWWWGRRVVAVHLKAPKNRPFFRTISEIQWDLDEYLAYYNLERSHQDHRLKGTR